MMLELILFIIELSPGVSSGAEKPKSCSVEKYNSAVNLKL